MKEAVIPFLGYIVLQVIVCVVGLNVVRERKIGFNELLKTWVFGQMLLFAVLQVMAVPMVLAKWRFNVLFWSYIVACAALFALGCTQLRQVRLVRSRRKPWTTFTAVLFLIALMLIGMQFHKYLFMMHIDEDDARWLAEANDALEYGDMMIRNCDTGEYLGHIGVPKDGTSPWPMMFAILSRLLHTRVPVFAHTIYASVELLFMYAVYWLMATELFKANDSRFTFLFSVAAINLFFGKTVYIQSTFSLVRIWQGKGTVAAVVIPLLFFLFIRIQKRDDIEYWRLVPVTCCAACLMSGMGISLSAITAGLLGAGHILFNRKWNRIPMLALSLLPSGLFLLVYIMFKSLF